MKTKFWLLFLSLILSVLDLFSQTAWEWAKSNTGTGLDIGNAVCTDATGNVYVTGKFGPSTTFFGGTSMSNAGERDVFVVKYDASGNVLWAKGAGGIYADEGKGICSDYLGNVYITGFFYSPTIYFGNNITLTSSSGSSRFFIAKYDSMGNVLWVKGAEGWCESYGITSDRNGNIYATGRFGFPSITFDTITLMTVDQVQDFFLVKYNTSGDALWAKRGGGSGAPKSGYSIVTDKTGYIYTTGSFASPIITFDSINLINANPNSSNWYGDTFIAKFDSSGNVIWAKSAGDTLDDESYSIAIDFDGNEYITGLFYSPTITFGNTKLVNPDGSGSNFTMFIVKYDPMGNVIWAKSAGGSAGNTGLGVSVDSRNNIAATSIYATGYFNSSSVTFGTTTLINAGIPDLFIVKYDSSGNALWATSTGGIGYDISNGISTDGSGNVYITGGFTSATLAFGGTTLSNTGIYDFFCAKLSNVNGIIEENNRGMFTIYPNPAIDKIYLNQSRDGAEVIFYNALGTLVKSEKVRSQEIRVGDLPEGIYFVQLKTADAFFTTKVIIQR